MAVAGGAVVPAVVGYFSMKYQIDLLKKSVDDMKAELKRREDRSDKVRADLFTTVKSIEMGYKDMHDKFQRLTERVAYLEQQRLK
jgi:formiminotetrahydrofolate cyclodeaminase